MNVESNRFALLRDLFAMASELEGTEREAFIRARCGADGELERELRALLETDGSAAKSEVTGMLADATRAFARGAYEALVGTRLGAYKLVSVLGWGGSGVVYLAERADRQYAARVAIKIIDDVEGTSELSARGRIERQILATMNHPNIARLLDAGETAQRHPYIVMEYVEGESITRHCDDKRLSIEARLKLFLQVCAAVQYAHQNLVVHRDLKPSNILVADGTPKLLDFGIAKILPAAEMSVPLTRINDRPLTPEYASPEQLKGQAITTGSDVYALGVILYELLAGVPPYRVSLNEPLLLHHAICVADPPKPSSVVEMALKQHQERARTVEVASLRSVTPARLRDLLEGDLDAIIMRALRKEPEHRYASVEAFAADIQRCLDVEPVKARQGNWWYYSMRMVRKHVVAVGGIVVLIMALGGVTVTSALLYKQARAEKDVSERVSNFMGSIFSEADPYVVARSQVTALQLLDSATQKLGMLGDDPLLRFRLLTQLGTAYWRLAQYPKAVTLLQAAIEEQRKLPDVDPLARARLHIALGKAFLGSTRLNEAGTEFLEARRVLEANNAEKSPEYADLLLSLANLELLRGEISASEEHYLRGIALSQELNGNSSEQVAWGYEQLASLYWWKNDLAAAAIAAKAAFNIYERILPEHHPDRISSYITMANIYLDSGNIQEASAAAEHALKAYRELYPSGNAEMTEALKLVADVRQAQGRAVESELLWKELMRNSAIYRPKDAYVEGAYKVGYAAFLWRQSRYAEAEFMLRALHLASGRDLPTDHQYIASAEHWLGQTLLSTHRIDEAITTLTASRDRWQRCKAATWFVARTESALGQALLEHGDHAEGERLIRSSYEVLLKERGPNDEATRLAKSRVDVLDQTAVKIKRVAKVAWGSEATADP